MEERKPPVENEIPKFLVITVDEKEATAQKVEPGELHEFLFGIFGE